MPDSSTTIKIDLWSVIKIILSIILLVFLYLIRDIVLITLTAAILATIFIPLVDYLEEKKRIPRAVSALLIFLIGFLIFLVLIFTLIPLIAEQFSVFIKTINDWLKGLDLTKWGLEIPKFSSEIFKEWQNLPFLAGKEAISFFGSLLGRVISVIITLVITFYLICEKWAIVHFFRFLLPKKHRMHFVSIFKNIQKEIGLWARQLILSCLAVGIMVYLGLTILDVRYALILGILALIFEIIPYFGPALAGIFGVLFAFVQSPTKGLLTIVLFLVIQRVDNDIIVPQLMKGVGGLSPLAVIIVAMIGVKLAGFIGLLLAVPVATICSICLSEWLRYRKLGTV